MATIGTLLFTWTKGRKVGTDQNGNTYYVERKAVKGRRARRWVIYKRGEEASEVPAEWHGWLHYTCDEVLTAKPAWTAPHEPNQTGTANAYLPPGHDLRGGKRERAAGDYQAWQP